MKQLFDAQNNDGVHALTHCLVSHLIAVCTGQNQDEPVYGS